MATIFILCVLVLLITYGYPRIIAKSEGAKCLTNMRNVHAGLAAFVADKGHWPEEPLADTQDLLEDWWVWVLKPYGPDERSWVCPTVYRLVTSRTKDNRPKLHYWPTWFDAKPGTPYRYATQPWLVENGNNHGNGANVCFPDGSIKPMNEIRKKKVN